ncbi:MULTISPECIES: YueI family protein [unclassified Enterococcus]|uniref:YueI family protein n=1 Tax=unclassified Enterococcus TaxID=2608891 RepID=UPI001551DB22|nr:MULTISPECIES: YueI family protein [unclassified Enterococcus]MBS7576187.1 YueI family protein [Enterococcus sp. MMGLQ5-2]MBS7583420.1 YueI family protein [Enterococcus sp. MMGLQ5-1]NPD11280.1 YueI family protein [Enterococcus sp. MMGLQ5-1]NPD36023.1 YueI family protein [Enterococcus sp. MMGLQ5-2]
MGIEEKLEQGFYGKPELKPAEQKKYLGTFRERVILIITNQDASQAFYQKIFSQKLNENVNESAQLSMKINDLLDDATKMKFIKLANELTISSTVVTKNNSIAPEGCAVVVHSNQAVNKEVIDIHQMLDVTDDTFKPNPKRNFFSKLLKNND